jgi:hypothetical protein
LKVFHRAEDVRKTALKKMLKETSEKNGERKSEKIE